MKERPSLLTTTEDVLTRLPTQKASQIEELLPHRWQPEVVAA